MIKELKKLFVEKDITVDDVSARTGLKKPRLYAILSGKSDLKHREMIAIIKGLNLSASETFQIFFR